jgi:hypothetical protein
MLHGAISLSYYIYTIVSGRFLRLPSILILFQIPYILTLMLVLMCSSISLLAMMFIGRQDLRTSTMDGGVGVPGLNEDFNAWLFKWGVIALTSVQEAALLSENDALRMPRTTVIENEDLDLEEEEAMRSGIGLRREWIRTGTVPTHRNVTTSPRMQNFRTAAYYVRATFRTYLALILRWLNGQSSDQFTVAREGTPYFTRGATPYNEDDDPDYVFSDRETSSSLSDQEESYEEDFSRQTTPGPSFPLQAPSSGFVREAHSIDRSVREVSPLEPEMRPTRARLRRMRETTPFGTLEPNPPSSYNANPPSPDSELFSNEDELPSDPLTELFPNFAATMTNLFNPSSQAESEDSQILISHLSSKRILTRSRYRDETEPQRLESFVRNRRTRRRSSNARDEDHDVADVQKCAICHTNPRVIVIWPCRFALLKKLG